ncbi:MAG TPA: alpha/beta hydrolase [Terracidiphilus sp.]|jgi:esterase/lipase superfamily enzyme|nr:alpha/beta hydrolase [Terracidiphilus sp.]
MRWLITNRNQDSADGFGCDLASLTYWTADPAATPGIDLTKRSAWTAVTAQQFQDALVAVASSFPSALNTSTADQRHVSVFVHGYNNNFIESTQRYQDIAATLFDGPEGLGELVSFDWPSKGSLLGYLPDRVMAKRVGDDLTNVLEALYDWMATKQVAATKNLDNACRARTSLIAHSMGNYALQYAMEALWTRKNRPLLVSLLQEVLMVAADVDNDIFQDGEGVSDGGGEGLANLSYRITALYTGRDDVLGSSAGLKHFGKRRLGRSGLDRTCAVSDNVWDVDCSSLLSPNVNGIAIHGEYFVPTETKLYTLMRRLLQGTDRSVLIAAGVVPPANPRMQAIGMPLPGPIGSGPAAR